MIMCCRISALLFALSFACLGKLPAGPAVPIPVIPTQPTDFEKRELGTGGTGDVTIAPPPPRPPKTYRRVNYIAVSPERNWKNAAGVEIRGSLLAFDEGNADTVELPLTLIKDGKVRLLKIGGKVPHVFPLTILSEADQKFVRDLDKANRELAKVNKPAA